MGKNWDKCNRITIKFNLNFLKIEDSEIKLHRFPDCCGSVG